MIENSPLFKLHVWLENFTEKTGKLIAWLTLIMVLLSFLIVLLRYGFNIGSIALQESILYLHATVFMLGAAYTLKADGHVRVDIFYQKMSLKNKAKVDFFGSLILLLPVSVFIFCICFDYVSQSWAISEQSSEAGGLAFVYLNKSLLLMLPILLILQALAEMIQQVFILKGYQPNQTLPNGGQI
ncbi:TRAP transporter small permease subunit [Thalassotalea agariperforans]